jgi:cob(I)alamin adenosyltransferase
MKNQEKIYTKYGDKGYTQLLSGEKVPKYNLRIEAYGNIDEATAFIGFLYDNIDIVEINDDLLRIISDLFVIEAHLSNKSNSADSLPKFSYTNIQFIEDRIDHYASTLNKLNKFILPIGDFNASFCHIIRTVIRRAERRVCELTDNEVIPNKDLIISYLNRLSDYFFVLSRNILHLNGKEERYWEY